MQIRNLLQRQKEESAQSCADDFLAMAHEIAAGKIPTEAEIDRVLLAANKSRESLIRLAEAIQGRVADHAAYVAGAATEESLADVDAKLGKIDDVYSDEVGAASSKRDKKSAPLIAERNALLSTAAAGEAARRRLLETVTDPAISEENERLSARRATIRQERARLTGQRRGIVATGSWPLTGIKPRGTVALEKLDRAGKPVAIQPPTLSDSAKERLPELDAELAELDNQEAGINERRAELNDLKLLP